MGKVFDNKKYLKLQSNKILERVNLFGDKLYIEFGGKLFDDYHASRVLPGFEIDSKVKVLASIKKKLEVIITISADDIQNGKVRNDLGIPYEDDVLRLIDEFEKRSIVVGSVVITRFASQPLAVSFSKKLKNLGIKVYFHYNIDGYPHDTEHVLSEEGFGKNEYIETSHPIIIVTGPGPGSGKMATCLSQLYHDNIRGIRAGYSKYETFPVWNLPLRHPVNLAYEAATADLNDVNMIDHFHLEAYNESAVNYNRDVEVFPVLNKMFERIYGTSPYKSPTDMGVNMVGFAIIDEESAKEASKQEIIRRYLDALCFQKVGKFSQESVEKIYRIIKELNISIDDRKVVSAAIKKMDQTNCPAVAIQVNKNKIICGKKTKLLSATSAAIINVLKFYAKIPDELPLLPKSVIEPLQDLRSNRIGRNTGRLQVYDVLVALAITATTNPIANAALEQLPKLAGAQLHSTTMLDLSELEILNKLKINTTMGTFQDSKLLKEI